MDEERAVQDVTVKISVNGESEIRKAVSRILNLTYYPDLS
jgi:hypothetical protein